MLTLPGKAEMNRIQISEAQAGWFYRFG